MKLDYSDKTENKVLNTALEIICALILGGAVFYVFISMFGLSYGPDKMTSGGIAGGLAGIWNSIADTLGNLDYVILPKYSVTKGASGSVEYGMALTLILAALTAISFLMIKARSRLLLLIFVVPVVIMILGFGVSPSPLAGACLAAALLIAIAAMRVGRGLKTSYFIVPLIAILIGTGVMFAIDKTVTLAPPKALSDIGASMGSSIEKMRYASDPLPCGKVGSVDGKTIKESRGDIRRVKEALSAPAKNDKESKAALEVTMSTPGSYYLRGFVGSGYEKNSWSTLDNGTFYGMRDRMFWLNRRGFDGLSELSMASALGGTQAEENKISVKTVDASKKIAFTPYELVLEPEEGNKARKSEMKLPAGTRNYGGSYLGTEGAFGRSSYEYTASQNITGEWTDAVGKLYTAPKNKDIDQFFINESHYNVEQYDKYLDIPDKLVKVIEKEIGSPGDISQNHADYKEAINNITKYLKEKYIYSETFTAPKEGKDFVEDFVTAKRGADIHFATLATLMFRYYGIPARYIEGYLITPANVQGMSGKSEISVPKAANHAWTEIYIDGFGWIPVEVTAEYSGLMKEADLTKGLQNVDYESLENNQSEVKEQEPVDEENEDDSKLKALLIRILLIVLAVIGIGLLAFLLFLIGIRIATFIKWRRLFGDKDPKVGVSALYQYSKNKKWKLAEAAEALGLRASYSTEKIEEKEREKMREEVKRAKERAKNSKGKAEKAKDKSVKKDAAESSVKDNEKKGSTGNEK